MIDIEALKYEIVERLKPFDPDKIILFGSYAYGTPNEDSAIDLHYAAEVSLKAFLAYENKKILRLISAYHIKGSYPKHQP